MDGLEDYPNSYPVAINEMGYIAGWCTDENSNSYPFFYMPDIPWIEMQVVLSAGEIFPLAMNDGGVVVALTEDTPCIFHPYYLWSEITGVPNGIPVKPIAINTLEHVLLQDESNGRVLYGPATPPMVIPIRP